MNSVERVKAICKERKIAISKLEKDLGFSNGYIGQLKKGVFPEDRLRKIADYLNLSAEFLATGEETKEPEKEKVLNEDVRRIARAHSKMPKEVQERFMTAVTASFPDYFSEDYEDTDTEE